MMILFDLCACAKFRADKKYADASSFPIGAHLPAMCNVVERLPQADAEPRSSPRFVLSPHKVCRVYIDRMQCW